MLKILNNDKFTTAQNRHSLVSLKIPILNTLPVRAKVKANHSPILLPLQGALIPRVLPWAVDWLPLSGRSFSRFVRLSCAHASPLVVWQKNAQRFFRILNALLSCCIPSPVRLRSFRGREKAGRVLFAS